MTGLNIMTASNEKAKKVHTKKKTTPTVLTESKQAVGKKPRKRSPVTKKKLTFKERAAQQGPLRSTLLLVAAVAVVCVYAVFIEADMAHAFKSYQDILIVFLGFICFHFLLIYIGYRIGIRKASRRKTRK